MLGRIPEVIDEAFFQRRVLAAIAYRERLLAASSEAYTAHRVIHSEADGIPGLSVDRYADVLVLQQHSAALESFMPAILETLCAHYKPRGVLARNDSPVRDLEGLERSVTVLRGQVPEKVAFQEAEVQLFAAPFSGQKTGAFLDQRENHVYVGHLAFGRALDVFAYHGGFSLQLARCAESVLAIDSSTSALAQLQDAANANGLNNLQPYKADAFEALRAFVQADRTFDIIVLDPPAFAKGRSQVPAALKAYKDINLQALKLLKVGGRLVTASCSYHVSDSEFYATLQEAAADARLQLRVLARRTQASCHPELLALPESHYLKLYSFEVVDCF